MTPGFRSTIAAQRTGAYDGDRRALWRVVEPLLYWSPSLASWLVVPAGFITNYASVPRLPFLYAMYGDKVYEEPALHDLLYTLRAALVVQLGPGGEILGEPVLRPLERRQADALFLEALLLNPAAVDEAEASAMHMGVRVGGGSSWRDETNITQPEFIRKLIQPLPPEPVPTYVPAAERQAG